MLWCHQSVFKLTSGPLKNNQKLLIQSIKNTIEKLDFTLLNDDLKEPIRVKRYFNKYRVGYHRMYKDNNESQMLDHILIETMLTFKLFPCEKKPVSNYITKFLEYEKLPNLIDD